jgi:hypothetical protein
MLNIEKEPVEIKDLRETGIILSVSRRVHAAN